ASPTLHLLAYESIATVPSMRSSTCRAAGFASAMSAATFACSRGESPANAHEPVVVRRTLVEEPDAPEGVEAVSRAADATRAMAARCFMPLTVESGVQRPFNARSTAPESLRWSRALVPPPGAVRGGARRRRARPRVAAATGAARPARAARRRDAERR